MPFFSNATEDGHKSVKCRVEKMCKKRIDSKRKFTSVKGHERKFMAFYVEITTKAQKDAERNLYEKTISCCTYNRCIYGWLCSWRS